MQSWASYQFCKISKTQNPASRFQPPLADEPAFSRRFFSPDINRAPWALHPPHPITYLGSGDGETCDFSASRQALLWPQGHPHDRLHEQEQPRMKLYRTAGGYIVEQQDRL